MLWLTKRCALPTISSFLCRPTESALNATVFDRALSAFTVCVRNFSSFNSAALRSPSCPFCSIRFFLPSAFSRVGKRAKALWADPRPAAGSAISASGRSGERRRFMVSHPRRFPDARSGNDLVQKWLSRYASHPDDVARMTEHSKRYLFHIVEALEARQMPAELALLPFIESAYDPRALSVAKAAGIWQFVPATGREYALAQNLFRDERRDVLASTDAALDYLSKLYETFGDWHFALAAYDWGMGNVQRAIKRNQRAGLPADYASLRMPNETRDYVPKLQAIKRIVFNPRQY